MIDWIAVGCLSLWTERDLNTEEFCAKGRYSSSYLLEGGNKYLVTARAGYLPSMADNTLNKFPTPNTPFFFPPKFLPTITNIFSYPLMDLSPHGKFLELE